jgi:hypothetical protein
VLKDHIYHYEQVVLGGDLNAITYAHKTSSYFINSGNSFVFPFDPNDNVSGLGIDATTNDKAWESISYNLCDSGLNPLGHSVAHVQVHPHQSELLVTTKTYTTIRISYSKLKVFDTSNVVGLPETAVKTINYRVFDWFDVKSGAKHEHDFLESGSDFCQKIYFYLSKRIMGNKSYKDLVVESLMTEKQLRNADYSSGIVKLKAHSMMKDAGIKGTGHGKGKHRPIKLIFNSRNIVENKLITYKKESNIEIGVPA